LARDIWDELSILVVAAGQFYSVPVLSAVLSVGRKEGADIRLRDRFVSARHAVLRFEDGIATVEDVGSLNGVRVRDMLIGVGKPTRLRPGDVIQIGASALTVRRHHGSWTPPPPPPPLAGAAALSGPAGVTEMSMARLDVTIDADPLIGRHQGRSPE
jgi:predicted component of type VI protein secretion system